MYLVIWRIYWKVQRESLTFLPIKLRWSMTGKLSADQFGFGMVTNSRSVGGFSNMVGKNIVFDDGLFEADTDQDPEASPLLCRRLLQHS